MLQQRISSVFVVYRRKTLTGSTDPTHANGTNKPCISRKVISPNNTNKEDIGQTNVIQKWLILVLNEIFPFVRLLKIKDE